MPPATAMLDLPAVAAPVWPPQRFDPQRCLLSNRDDGFRLFVPPAYEGALAEMRSSRSVTIEPSAEAPDAVVEIVFEDGSDTPFAIAHERRSIDGALGRALYVPFTVWTVAGKQLTLRADVLI
ncbi:hypothetical protein [Derxia lacustris]|uniref:hypothetical protein n=1 Tax=Derxia lacustris TaxID=764842 RepID=UPI00111C3DD5|nr:hypothetical protein [Derxia lacustris]